MKIAIIIEHFDPTRGGAEAISVWLAGRLAAANHDVHVLCHDSLARTNRFHTASLGASHNADRSRHAGSSSLEPPPDGVTLHRFTGLKLSNSLGFRMFGRRVRDWCYANNPDIAHSMTVAWPGDVYHPHAGVYASIHRQSIASRETVRQASLKRWLLQFSAKQQTLLKLERRAIADPSDGGAWKILCIGSAMITDFQKYYQVDPKRLLRLDNPLMVPPPSTETLIEYRAWFRAHYSLSSNDRVALFAGHDFRRKGLSWALRTIAQTREPWILLVIGLGKTRQYVDLAQSLGIANRVKFVGPTREMSRAYAAADALVFPTFYESFGLVALEAMSHGLPVISTQFLGCHDLVENNQAGTIVDSPTNVKAMAAALDALPLSDPKRTELPRHTLMSSLNLAPDTYLKKLMSIYTECITFKRSYSS